MKKITVLSLILSSFLMAQDYKYEITPVVGYNIAEGNLNLKNQNIIGAEFQYNGCTSGISPEIGVLYSDADYEDVASGATSTDIYRIAVNGVKEFDKIGFFTPLAKAGLGYETMSEHNAGNKESVFVDAGVGAKIPLMDHLALKLEAVYMLKNNDNRWDNNLALLAGLNFAFGGKDTVSDLKPVESAKAEPAPEPVKEEPKAVEPVAVVATTATVAAVAVVDGDDDKDGVLNSADKCPTTPAGDKVDASGCALAPVVAEVVDGDDDKDGVLNSKDKCPTTPAGEKVNDDGCSAIVNLHIKFETNSSKVDAASKINVTNYANFLKANSAYSTTIIGHTDSAGSASSNQKLSLKRANIVKDMLVKEGVEASRISASGMGETKPMASNKTADGKAKNRRIEATLVKK